MPARTPAIYRHLDTASGALLLFMTVWAPWAFGCTTSWAIRVMNVASYALGLLLVAKWAVRWRTGYTPARWSEPTPAGRWVIRGLAFLSVAILAYVLAGALNYRATTSYSRAGVEFLYTERPPLTWLPASYDARQTWPAFWNWLGIALSFWAARDWVQGKSRRERRQEGEPVAPFPSDRLSVWLWTLVLNSSLLALECILQRLDGTDKLLWLVKPAMASTPDFRFGPFAYRTNAAQYFNLVWPVALGFWWALQTAYRERHGLRARVGGGAHVLLLPCTLLLAACPVISASRGGAMIMVALTAVAVVVVLLVRGFRGWLGPVGLGALLVGALGLGLLLGGEGLSQRFAKTGLDLNGREEIYEAAHRMLPDFVWLGSGAGTFPSLYPIYRVRTQDPWASYAHNDWLETRITLGWIGFGILVLMLLCIPVLAGLNRRRGVSGEFTALVGIALAGMLTHAVFDFPFRIHSLLFLFCFLLAVVSGLGRKQAS